MNYKTFCNTNFCSHKRKVFPMPHIPPKNMEKDPPDPWQHLLFYSHFPAEHISQAGAYANFSPCFIVRLKIICLKYDNSYWNVGIWYLNVILWYLQSETCLKPFFIWYLPMLVFEYFYDISAMALFMAIKYQGYFGHYCYDKPFLPIFAIVAG